MIPDTPSRDARDVRGDETRRRLLTAGVAAFGASGYDGVSTRELAHAARANQAAILYHFGGKAPYYAAVAGHVAAHGRAALERLLAPPDPGAAGPAAAVAGLARTLEAMVRGLLDLAGDGAAAAFIVREQTQPGPGFDVLYDGYLRPLHERVTTWVARATGRAPDAPDTIVDAHAVIGMALAFAVARETLLRRTGWDTYTPARVDQVATQVSRLAVCALGLTPDAGPAVPGHPALGAGRVHGTPERSDPSTPITTRTPRRRT